MIPALPNNNRLAAPLLLIAALLILVLFHGFIFTRDDVVYIYTGPEEETEESSADYIEINDIKYIPDRFFIFTVILNICAFLLPAVFYIKLKGSPDLKSLRIKLPRLKYLPLCGYMTASLLSGSVLVNSLMFYTGETGGVTPGPAGGIFGLNINSGGNPVYDAGILLSLVVFPALCEEFFFRSVIAAEYEKYGALCAAVMSSSAFALTRFSPGFFPAYFFAGVILYMTVKITGSVIYAAALHAGYNIFNIYLRENLNGILNLERNRLAFIFVTAVIFLSFAIFALKEAEDIYYNRGYSNEPSPEYAERKQESFAAAKSLLSPSFIIAAGIFFVYIFIIIPA
ncbi:MAG: CPBP family intramembrane metalloprotease [Oscillospiraceae bacterium]|nr:CPBP family intramembrane metalloprotease [Oscillospiraceae bacterium]